jgi:class 3 adenylate cyclase
VYTRRGAVALAAGRTAVAADFLDESIRRGRRGKWSHVEGYAHKDRALVYLAAGDLARAEQELRVAEQLFRPHGFDEGLAHVNRARGRLLRVRGRHDEAERALGDALAYFERQGDRAEVARTLWERAEVARARGAPASLVADALLRALDAAEGCRRHALVRQIQAELRQADEAAYCRRIYQRARGHDVAEDTASLLSGHRETATVLFLDLQGSTDYMRVTDPEVVMLAINQMMADLAGVLERHGAEVTAYLGDGFMALVRGRDHARRGVAAALDLGAALEEFNRPRRVLGLPLLRGRVGVSTGEVFLGNVDTYQKMDFTALGTTVNLAARLQPEAEPGQPCISRQTYEQVQEQFVFREGNPRTVTLKGLGSRQVWDVVGAVP